MITVGLGSANSARAVDSPSRIERRDQWDRMPVGRKSLATASMLFAVRVG
ncbi:MAG TPA: hypothetical protein VND98_10080 [Solirubrobacterales bacterium]|nr:hypothetical protein [Solirubrobacterales bacterium]